MGSQVSRQPHVRRVHLPPAEPPRESRLSLAVGLVAIALALFFVVILLPVLG
jgi:hypothetical protein